MNYNTLLELATNVGYELAMAGAETFRVEESIVRIMAAYGVEAEVFAIPNYLVVSITDDEGHPITKMHRIGSHGNNLDSVEKFSNLSRALCNRKPEPNVGLGWFDYVKDRQLSTYSLPWLYFGYFLGAAGHALFFGGSLLDRPSLDQHLRCVLHTHALMIVLDGASKLLFKQKIDMVIALAEKHLIILGAKRCAGVLLNEKQDLLRKRSLLFLVGVLLALHAHHR